MGHHHHVLVNDFWCIAGAAAADDLRTVLNRIRHADRTHAEVVGQHTDRHNAAEDHRHHTPHAPSDHHHHPLAEEECGRGHTVRTGSGCVARCRVRSPSARPYTDLRRNHLVRAADSAPLVQDVEGQREKQKGPPRPVDPCPCVLPPSWHQPAM